MNWRNVNASNMRSYLSEKELKELDSFSNDFSKKLKTDLEDDIRHKQNMDDIDLATSTLILLNQYRCSL